MLRRNGRRVQYFATIRPAPAAPPVGASITWWLVAVVVLSVIVVSGVVLTSRR